MGGGIEGVCEEAQGGGGREGWREGGMDSWIGGVAGGGDATEVEFGGACALEGGGGEGVSSSNDRDEGGRERGWEGGRL